MRPFETGVIVYDALFLAFAEDGDTVVVTADGKLSSEALEGTPYAHLAHLWLTLAASSPARAEDRRRTATRPVQASTQRTSR